MKTNKNFIVTVIAFLLISSLLLASGILAIAEMPGGERSYIAESFASDVFVKAANDKSHQSEETLVSCLTQIPETLQPSITPEIEDAPFTQAELKERFAPYVHENGESVSIFNDSQVEQFLAIRESGKRNALTYDEVLYLINDTISLYFQYDEIIIQKEMVKRLQFTDYLGGDSGIIKPADPNEDYAKVIRDLYSLIIYRIYLHDSGMIAMTTGNECYWKNGDLISNFHFLFEGDELLQSENFFEAKRIFLLSFDKGTEIGQTYNNSLQNSYMVHCQNWGGYKKDDENAVQLDSQLLIIDLPLDDSYKFVSEYKITIARKNAEIRDTLFPTTEISDLKPYGYYDEVYSFPLKNDIQLALNFSLENPNYDYVLTAEEAQKLIEILDSRPWERGIHVDEKIRYRFDVEHMGINYCCGALYNSSLGNYLKLSSDEIQFIESLIQKYS